MHRSQRTILSGEMSVPRRTVRMHLYVCLCKHLCLCLCLCLCGCVCLCHDAFASALIVTRPNSAASAHHNGPISNLHSNTGFFFILFTAHIRKYTNRKKSSHFWIVFSTRPCCHFLVVLLVINNGVLCKRPHQHLTIAMSRRTRTEHHTRSLLGGACKRRSRRNRNR